MGLGSKKNLEDLFPPRLPASLFLALPPAGFPGKKFPYKTGWRMGQELQQPHQTPTSSGTQRGGLQRIETHRGAGKLGKSWRIWEKEQGAERRHLRSDFNSQKANHRMNPHPHGMVLRGHAQLERLCASQESPSGEFWDEERLPEDTEPRAGV